MKGPLAASLNFWLEFIRHAKPRLMELRGKAEPPVVVFVDGCCEPPLWGVGAVLVDRAHDKREAWGVALTSRAAHDLRARTH